MKLLQRFFDFYLDASVHVALGVISLYKVTIALLQFSTNWFLLGFLFFGTIVCYNFIKYGVEAKKYVIVTNPYHKAIQVFSFLSFLLAIYFFFYLDFKVWITVMVLGLLSTLYAIPFLPKAKNLRSLGGMKIFLVALVWVGCTVVLPVVDNKLFVTWNTGLQMIQRFLLILVLLLPFEIRDLVYDNVVLKTIPQRIGIKKTKLLGYLFILVYVFLELFKEIHSKPDLCAKLLLCLVLIIVLYKTKEKQSKYYASFYVESISIGYYFLLNLFLMLLS